MQIACNANGTTGSMHIFSVIHVTVLTSRSTRVLFYSARGQAHGHEGGSAAN
jgi:hypothetical protein